MAHLWLLSVVVLVLTLAPMHAAWAQSAWVLWHRAENTYGVLNWGAFSAWESRQQCNAARAEAYKDAGVDNVPRAGFAAYQDAASKKTVRFDCFPDTIDPRGPKGAGR